MIRIPIYPPTMSGTKCYQLRIYKFGESVEVEPDIWTVVEKYGVGYWHYGHTEDCDRQATKRRCVARGWFYWQDGASEQEARASMARYLLNEIRPRMPDRYDAAFEHGPWNSLGLYEKFDRGAI